MNLLYFTSKNGFACEQIIHDLTHVFPDLSINMLPTLKNLKISLRQGSLYKNTIILFMIDSEKELKNLLKLKDFLTNSNVVLILPNKKQMFHMGAKLYPRFMTDFNNARFEINPVLHKLIEKYQCR